MLGFEAPGNSQLGHETFELEIWMCDLGRHLAEDRGYAQQCRIERVGRWLMVVETAAAGWVLIAIIWNMRNGKEILKESVEDKGKQREASQDGRWI